MTTPTSGSGPLDAQTDEVMLAIAQVVSEMASRHGIPAVPRAKIELAAMAGFKPKLARRVVADMASRDVLRQTWQRYEDNHGPGSVPHGVAFVIRYDADFGLPAWTQVLRNLTGFGTDLMDRQAWSDLQRSLKPDPLPEADRTGWFAAGDDLPGRANQPILEKVTTRGAATPGELEDEVKWQPTDWSRTQSLAGFRLGWRLHQGKLLVGLYSESYYGKVNLKLRWPSGEDLTATLEAKAGETVKQACELPGVSTIPQNALISVWP
ncbi:MAG: hypothetical protein LBJ62_11395 [Bifidobacteriaceae bacterium]|jgi:hypothetical protein|nr:hypothetical protein [Bifidobacteriaceae bacterium]